MHIFNSIDYEILYIGIPEESFNKTHISIDTINRNRQEHIKTHGGICPGVVDVVP